eukprot:6931234-Prymnesium_polylepis.1
MSLRTREPQVTVCDSGDGSHLRGHAQSGYAELKKVSYGRRDSRRDLAFRRSDALARKGTPP